MRVGSLFAGIGGFDLGFERCGFETVWQVEQSEFCRSVLARHFPDAERFEDVRDVGAHNLSPVDLVCGGFPCQDISLAGKGAGIDGERSGLWSEMWRVIRELEPRWVVVENVPALTSRGLDRVLRDLASIGYDAEWDCLSAAQFGAPHLRRRIWLVAYPGGDGRCDGKRGAERHEGPARVGAGDAGQFGGDRGGWAGRGGRAAHGASGGLRNGAINLADPEGKPERPGGAGRDVADADQNGRRKGLRESSGANERSGPRDAEWGGELQDPDGSALQPWRVGGRVAQTGGSEWWAAEPPLGRVAHGVPDRLDQLAALGNALVPQIAEWLGRRILDYEQSRMTQKAA